MEKTLGEQRVRTDFNAAGNSKIDLFKTKTAELINILEEMKPGSTEEEYTLITYAQKDYENAAMWAVKAVTF